MSTENGEVFIEDILNIAAVSWFDTLYKGRKNIELATLIHHFMIESVDRYLPPAYKPGANVRITAGQYAERSAVCMITLGFDYSDDYPNGYLPGLPTLTRYMRLDWDNNRWSLEARDMDTFRIVRIIHQGQTASFFPPALYLN